MRARLYSVLFAEVAMLDAVATRTLDPDGAGALVSGFDDDFKEIVVVDQSGSPNRVSARQEQDHILIPCNVEIDSLEALQQLHTGNVPTSKVRLVFAAKDMQAMNIVRGDTGEPLVRVNDRLVSIRDSCGRVVRAVRTPPGLFVTEMEPRFGFSQQGTDLFVATFEPRDQGVRS